MKRICYTVLVLLPILTNAQSKYFEHTFDMFLGDSFVDVVVFEEGMIPTLFCWIVMDELFLKLNCQQIKQTMK